LGLPIAQQLVQAHRGRIEFTSVQGRGSTFRLILPLAATARATSSHQAHLTDIEFTR
jgi:signal transduction histidine kinase